MSFISGYVNCMPNFLRISVAAGQARHKRKHARYPIRVERGSSRGLVNVLWKCECGDMYWERDMVE